MVSTRCSSFLLTFILLVHVGNSSSGSLSAYQAKEITVVAKGSELAVAESMRRLEISDGVPAAMDEVSNTRLGGRKMVLMKRVLREKMKEELLNKEDSKISGAARLVGNCNHRAGKGILNEKCKLMSGRRSVPLKDKRVRFTAFSADYHVPKSHPPKNN
ncbi:uncharacterized protein LOC131171737 [Hevea brasiliensis]|uniref:uncharacterized protein LOC131171737 n=1 Tax=Hevea brasiliensis TaxID=3981 RepID=UPI0025F35C5D|nr:uncharacterized protein LOC131171737 [Hevea brasiliensis]